MLNTQLFFFQIHSLTSDTEMKENDDIDTHRDFQVIILCLVGFCLTEIRSLRDIISWNFLHLLFSLTDSPCSWA